MPDLKRGVFIALEGVDGAGSSTQTRLLVDLLVEKGFRAVATKEPNPGGFIEPAIRLSLAQPSGSPVVDALLFAADRADHVERLIRPALADRKIVVSDRYLESSIAYQCAQGLDERWILAINKHALKPDLTIIMDIDPEISLKRKGYPRERYENSDFLKRVREKFLERAERKGHEVVDASKPVEEVHAEIVRKVLPLLISVVP
ncbi:MAG: Thymidylate kinase [Candidatus Methanosuratincola subterraneus]|uniref:Probable thymidylate kinase n=1 Tax=Methanosuratincola subterraneus TaxID=2593994 RepID=A0A444L6T8_METS7|nr:MAG: Thymidylate kinase [Candidatus Methanosuratincola subterraneus]